MRRPLGVLVAFLMLVSGIVVLLSCGGGGGGGDNGSAVTYYFDGDGDGYGNPALSSVFDSPQDGWVLYNTDCDDGNFHVNPGAVEICSDGIDNDCNGLVDCYDEAACDEDNVCSACTDADGDSYLAIAELCSGGDDCDDTDVNVNPGGTGAFGCPAPCSACEDDVDCGAGNRCIQLDGQWVCAGDCYDTGTCPAGYTCADQDNGDRLCVPESGSCTCLAANEGAQRLCELTNDYGTCTGFETCDPEEGWVGCTAFPQAEICDGLDNNCNGLTDEDFVDLGDACYAGLGECRRSGARVCFYDGTGTMCDAVPAPPSVEICDGKDNDCDGVVDEGFVGLGGACYAGIGECRTEGVSVCRNDGTGTMCDAVPGQPGDEICDGKDNDCDGFVDEEIVRLLCENQQGVCAGSRKTCGGASGWNQCGPDDYGPDYEPEETRCDGLDNDCDGVTDEGCHPV
jgi:hypothetical protein